MKSEEKFSLIRSILKVLGLSPEAIDDIIDRITDFLSDVRKKAAKEIRYPYYLRDDFLSPSEQSFYMVLKHVVSDRVLICPKVSLGDLFYVKAKDPSEFRIYTNKIDRKHIDFLLCDPKTVKPILGIELDDKSHKRIDRQERDEFVENVYKAANLKLIRIPAKRSYSTSELDTILQEHIGLEFKDKPNQSIESDNLESAPKCPKCGSEMILRTVKNGVNKGSQFWGCPNYPHCRGIINIKK